MMIKLRISLKPCAVFAWIVVAGCAEPRLNIGPEETGTGGASEVGSSGGSNSVAGSSTGGKSQAKGGSTQKGSTSGSQVTYGGTAGTTSVAPSCKDVKLPEAPKISFCARSMYVSTEGNLPESLAVEGKVIGVTNGPVTGGCSGIYNTPTVVLRVQTQSDDILTDYDVEYEVPTNPVSWKIGDTISVKYDVLDSFELAYISSLALRRNDIIEVYLQHGGFIDDFAAEPFTWNVGSLRCSNAVTCGTVDYYDLRVSSSQGTANLPYGENIRVGDYQVYHGGFTQGRSDEQSQCMDWSGHDFWAAALRVPK
jgi:hypothetical protein